MEEIKKFLEEWSSCNNRCTQFPYYWTIRDFKESYTSAEKGEYYFDTKLCSMEKVEDRLRAIYQEGDLDLEDITIDELCEDIGSIFEYDKIEETLEAYLNEKPSRYTMEYEPYYEGIFFTEKDAEEYLETVRNHHTESATTYLECFNKWGRDSRTEQFIKKLFEYFNVPLPPKMYKEKELKEVVNEF